MVSLYKMLDSLMLFAHPNLTDFKTYFIISLRARAFLRMQIFSKFQQFQLSFDKPVKALISLKIV